MDAKPTLRKRHSIGPEAMQNNSNFPISYVNEGVKNQIQIGNLHETFGQVILFWFTHILDISLYTSVV